MQSSIPVSNVQSSSPVQHHTTLAGWLEEGREGHIISKPAGGWDGSLAWGGIGMGLGLDACNGNGSGEEDSVDSDQSTGVTGPGQGSRVPGF